MFFSRVILMTQFPTALGLSTLKALLLFMNDWYLNSSSHACHISALTHWDNPPSAWLLFKGPYAECLGSEYCPYSVMAKTINRLIFIRWHGIDIWLIVSCLLKYMINILPRFCSVLKNSSCIQYLKELLKCCIKRVKEENKIQ